MDALHAQIARTRAALDDAGLYRRDPEGFRRLTEELARAGRDLAALEERWLDLELLRESIEGR